MGENISPDFTVFDYVIGFDFLSFSDRYFRMPFAFYNESGKPMVFKNRTLSDAEQLLAGKDIFCNFIYGHESAHGMREKLFERISEYKQVSSFGSYRNNMQTNGCTWAEKKDILRRSKFTIASDSITYPGFVTEKIVAPFIAGSVPIYFGDTEINADFNPDSFIWCRGEHDIDRVIAEIKKYDTDDEAYIKKLSEPVLNDTNYLQNMYDNLDEFLYNIFSQDRDYAFRRVRCFAAQRYEDALKSVWIKKYSNRKSTLIEDLYSIKKKLLKS